jgi:hypothetical protein
MVAAAFSPAVAFQLRAEPVKWFFMAHTHHVFIFTWHNPDHEISRGMSHGECC